MSVENELAGRVAVVTGSARNIGRAIALALAEGGAAVLVSAKRARADADAVAEEIRARGGRAAAALADVGDPASAASLIDAAVKAFGRVDILVNNASVRRETDLASLEYAADRSSTLAGCHPIQARAAGRTSSPPRPASSA